MEFATKEQWLTALLAQNGRLERLLSIMTGGTLVNVEWLPPTTLPTQDEEQAEFLQRKLEDYGIESQFVIGPGPWQGAGILHTAEGDTGLLVILAYVQQEDFYQEQLQRHLQWLQQMAQLNSFPIRMLLLAFSKVPDLEDPQLTQLESWQWEELLETGVQMAIGKEAALKEVVILPIVAYSAWLENIKQSEQNA